MDHGFLVRYAFRSDPLVHPLNTKVHELVGLLCSGIQLKEQLVCLHCSYD